MPVSIIIPVLNEEENIFHLLTSLNKLQFQGHEIIVVDGGSSDKTVSIAKEYADSVVHSPVGRANQMNAGAKQAKNELLWFLHADTTMLNISVKGIENALQNNHWGRFNVRLSGKNILFRLIERMINLRSCLTGIATGDQGIFINKSIFNRVKGYTKIPLMEDVDLSKKLKKIERPICLHEVLITSSRRWEDNGIIATVILMWRLRFMFWLGVSAKKLAIQYK